MDEISTIPATAFEPGIYHNMPADIYHSLPYASKTYLSEMLRSPKHAKWAIDNPCEQTPALRIGSAVHCLALEGETEYEKRFAVSSQCCAIKKDGDRCNNAGIAMVDSEWLCGVHLRKDRHDAIMKDVVARFCGDGFGLERAELSSKGASYFLVRPDGRCVRVSNHEAGWGLSVLMLRTGREDIRVDLPPYGRNDGRTVLTEDEHAQVSRMADAVWEHPFARDLLNVRTATEVSYVWDDKETGVRCKARIDFESVPTRSRVDLKTTMNADPEAVARAILDYDYHIQAAQYLSAPSPEMPEGPDEFSFIFVEKEEPHGVSVLTIDSESIQIGYTQRRKALTRWGECDESGIWPGYSDRPLMIGLPDYYKTKQLNLVEA